MAECRKKDGTVMAFTRRQMVNGQKAKRPDYIILCDWYLASLGHVQYASTDDLSTWDKFGNLNEKISQKLFESKTAMDALQLLDGVMLHEVFCPPRADSATRF